MNPNSLAPLVAAALAAAPLAAAAAEPVVTLDRIQLAAATDLHQHDAWQRWAEDFSRDMRASMGTMFGPRLSGGKVVKAAPYSAEVITEANQALPDGNVISRKTQGAIYRDGEGRTRQEMPGDGKERSIFINDPVGGTNIVLSPGSKRAVATAQPGRGTGARGKHTERQVIRLGGKEVRIEDGRVYVDGREATGGKTEVIAGGRHVRVENGRVTIDGKPVGEPADGKGQVDRVVVKTIDSADSPDGTRREEVRVQVLRAGDTMIPMPPIPPVPPGALNAPLAPLPPMPGVHTFRFESTGKLGKGVTTSLGMKDFDGVKAEGKSTVWTIAAGEIGNRNPINVTSESWYAPELQLTVYTRYHDPRTGESIYRLAGIHRGEPAPELFRVPAGFEVKRRGPGEAAHER